MTLPEIIDMQTEPRSLHDAMTWDEQGIDAGKRCQPSAADRRRRSFRLRTSAGGLLRTGRAHWAHCAEFLHRVAGGEDTRPGTAAGFQRGYPNGTASEHEPVRCLDWHDVSGGDRRHVSVAVPESGRAGCWHEQSATVSPTNRRSLHSRHPGVLTDVVFAAVVFGAYATDLPPRRVAVRCGPVSDRPVFDERGLSHTAVKVRACCEGDAR